MRRFPQDVDNSILYDTTYRNNVVTGEVAVDNGNNTYDVYIAGSDVAYPDIPTTLREPSFAVGEAVEILVEYGNKEMPIIIGRSKKVAQEFTEIEVSYSGGTSVTTLDAYSITGTTAYFEGRISIEEMENCTKQGFYYGTTTAYGSDTHTDGSYGDGTYNQQVNDLTGETTYHFQAYVLDADGDTQTGTDKTFTTSVAIAGYIFVYCWTAEDSYCIKSYTASGAYVKTFSVSELQDWNNVLAVDADNNVYCVNYNLLKCYDKDGGLLYQTSVTLSAVCVGPDGYIYTYELVEGEIRFAKRASGNSTIIESKTPSRQGGTQAFIMDSNKNIYITRYISTGTEKYNYNNASPLSVIAENADIYGYHRTFAIVNGVLAIGARGSYEIKTAELDLSAYINESLDIATITKPIGIGNIGNDFILCAYDNAHDYAVLGRYESDGTKVWETNIGTFADTTPYQVAAYPF